jgi:hypothetical protein
VFSWISFAVRRKRGQGIFGSSALWIQGELQPCDKDFLAEGVENETPCHQYMHTESRTFGGSWYVSRGVEQSNGRSLHAALKLQCHWSTETFSRRALSTRILCLACLSIAVGHLMVVCMWMMWRYGWLIMATVVQGCCCEDGWGTGSETIFQQAGGYAARVRPCHSDSTT